MKTLKITMDILIIKTQVKLLVQLALVVVPKAGLVRSGATE